MLTFTIGTFAIALNHLLLISALALATLVGWRVAKRGGENPESVLFSLFLLGMLAARIGFVLAYWPFYRDDPWQVVDLRDGGFLPWPGAIALLLGALFWGWRRPPLRKPLGAGVATGMLFWVLASLSPELFFRLDGQCISSRPMKGTAARGLWYQQDMAQAAALRASPKERAENLMITDMVRNEPNDALAIGGAQYLVAFGDPLLQPIDPEPAVGIEHDLDDLWIGKPFGNRPAHCGTQHARTAMACFDPDRFCGHGTPFSGPGRSARLDGDD